MSDRRVALYLACFVALAFTGLYVGAGVRPAVTPPRPLPRVAAAVLGSYELTSEFAQERRLWRLDLLDVTAGQMTCMASSQGKDSARDLWPAPATLGPNGSFSLRVEPWPGETGETWEFSATLGADVARGEARQRTPDGRWVVRPLRLEAVGQTASGEDRQDVLLGGAPVFYTAPAPLPQPAAPPASRFLTYSIVAACVVCSLPLLVSLLIERRRTRRQQRQRIRVSTRSLRRRGRRRRGAQAWRRHLEASGARSTLPRDALRSSDAYRLRSSRLTVLQAIEVLEAGSSRRRGSAWSDRQRRLDTGTGRLQVHAVGDSEDLSEGLLTESSRLRGLVDEAWGSGNSVSNDSSYELDRIQDFDLGALEEGGVATLAPPRVEAERAPRRSTASRRLAELLDG